MSCDASDARQFMPSPSPTDPETPSTSAGAEPSAGASRFFTGVVLDETPRLLNDSYSLRYQVYCLERGFLRAADYPDHLETDVFDRHSVHVGVVTSQGVLVATARLIEQSEAGLPLLEHCKIFTHETSLDDPARRVVEVSRLSVSRRFNRRAGDEFYSLQGATVRPDSPERRGGGEIVLTLYKALYQASKRRGYTHWLVATEKSLLRLVAKYGFPFRVIGPETDYYGTVSPYLMDLKEFDAVISGHRMAALDDFLAGLEAEFRPVEDNAGVVPIV
jgi:N-acyl amino acid synthase of PEP-CTERM/exosortase system